MAKRERRRAPPTPRRPSGKGDLSGEGASSAALEWIKSLAVAAVIFIVLRTFLVQTFVITSGSMEDTLLVGDFLVVNRAAIGTTIPFTSLRVPGYSRPRRGDVIVFDPHHEPDMKLVKRLIGMPGDTLEMRDQVLFLNGRRLEEPYVLRGDLPDAPDPVMSWQIAHLAPGVDPQGYRPTRDTWGPLVVPEEHYFMLGDNREASYDSRYWGMLEAWRLEGRAVFIYFSYDRDSLVPFKLFRRMRPGRIGDVIR